MNTTEGSLLRFEKASASDVNSAMDRLFEVFPDKYPRLARDEIDAWRFALEWPEEPAWFVDPNLAKAAREMFGLSLPQLIQYVEYVDCGAIPFVLSMFHSRALFAPAASPDVVFDTIVHVDAHDDLMPALVAPHGKVIVDSVTRQKFDPSDNKSVSHAIDSGAISKGSFLTAYILSHPRGQIIHVDPALSASEAWCLALREETRSIGGNIYKLTGIKYCKDSASGVWRLNEVPRIPAELPEARLIWLDIDLDAFCNRYDGDSDRTALTGSDEERHDLEHRIDTFLADVEASEWRANVAAISVAASPGFFPSEYWDYAIPRIRDGLLPLFCRN